MITAKEAKELREALQFYTDDQIEERIRLAAKWSDETFFEDNRVTREHYIDLSKRGFQVSFEVGMLCVRWR